MSRAVVQLLGPALLIVAVALVGGVVPVEREFDFQNALVMVAIVVALYTFVGNSGVISFGHVSFVAVGAFAAGLMTISAGVKRGIMPELFPILRNHSIGNVESLLLAAGLGAAFALLVGLPLMRLSGLAAGIADPAELARPPRPRRSEARRRAGGLRPRFRRSEAKRPDRRDGVLSSRSRLHVPHGTVDDADAR